MKRTSVKTLNLALLVRALGVSASAFSQTKNNALPNTPGATNG
jgi:hypothetical protein